MAENSVNKMAKHFLQALLQVSEKSARIARAWRCQDELFELMVEEKTDAEKSKRFARDFKTLADVLIQQVVKHDIISQFPKLQGFIFGEESNLFTNNNGSEVVIEVQQNSDDTAQLLCTVLEGKESAAHLLADVIHGDISLEEDELLSLATNLDFAMPVDKLGIWVDPIDSTMEYMSNSVGKEVEGIVVSGLPCATVLIGVFDRETGRPVAGVINQPFNNFTLDCHGNRCWTGRRIWGVCYGEHQCYCMGQNEGSFIQMSKKDFNCNNADFKVAISGSECGDVKDVLLSLGARTYAISGVGHKLLNVIDGNVDSYVLSQASSFRWDTCAPHAILASMGGGVVSYKKAVTLKLTLTDKFDIRTKLKQCELTYHKPNSETGKKWSNTGGLIAFKSHQNVFQLLNHLI